MLTSTKSTRAAELLTDVLGDLHETVRCCDARVKFELFGLLIGGPRDVGTLTHALRLDMPTISRNLKMLERRGLVSCRIARNRRVYALTEQIRVVHHPETVELVISAPAGGQFSIRIPRRVVEDAHAELHGARPDVLGAEGR